MQEIIDKYLPKAQDALITYIPKLFLAVVILLVGFKLIQLLLRFLEKFLDKKNFDKSVSPFLISMLSITLKVTLFYIVATILGANLSGLIAIMAAVGFAVGMALQGSLGNFASGILILVFKPYKIDDWIQVDDKFGQVNEIGIFNTTMTTPGQKIIIVPNSKITDDVVTNYSKNGVVRLEIEITMPYAESFPKVKTIIEEALKNVDNIVKEPVTEIGIENFESHSVQLTVRPYTKPENFWQVTFDTNQALKTAFSENKIQVAYSEGVELGSIGQ